MERSYPTDLTDAEYGCLEPYVAALDKRGRPKTHSTRETLGAASYVLKSGCPRRLLPRALPPWEPVYWWFRRWRVDRTFERLNAALREVLRARLGRKPLPSAEIVYSQSTKTTGVGGEQRGYDANKKVQGRKRHLLVGTEELVLKVKVHSTKVTDYEGIKALLDRAKGLFPRRTHLWMDEGYRGEDKAETGW